MNRKIWEILFIAFIAGISIFRLTHIGKLELAPDEAYFWEWSRHLAIAYSDQGPVLGLATFLSTHLVGKITEFSVRLSAVLLALGSSIFIYLLAKDIFKSTYSGFLSVFVLHSVPICAFGGMAMTADIPMVFFWTLSLYFVYKAIKHTGNGIYWYLAGISSALGIMSKYTMVFFIMSVFFFLLFSKKYLFQKEPYIALGLSLMGFLPMIIYNIKNNWPTYGYIKSLIFSGTSKYTGIRGLNGILEYIGGQFGVATPFIGLFFIYIIIFLFRKGFTEKNDGFLLLFFSSVTVLSVFGILSFFSSVEENWPVTAYISLSIAASGFLSSEFFKNMKHKIALTRYIIFSFGFGFILTMLIHAEALYSILGLPPWMDPVDRIRGWKKLGQEVSELVKENPDKTFVLSNYFGIASELAFYMNGHPEIRCVDIGQRLREYRYWSNFASLDGHNAVYVSQYPKIEPLVKSIFSTIELKKVINTYRDDYIIRKTYVFYCKNYEGNYRLPKSTELF